MEKVIQVHDIDGEDIPMVVITGVVKPISTDEAFVQNVIATSNVSQQQQQQQQQQRLVECCPTISESNILEEENLEIFREKMESEDSRRSSATSDLSFPISSNHSSPRSSFRCQFRQCSTVCVSRIVAFIVKNNSTKILFGCLVG